MNNPLILFLVELLKRFKQKSPKFFVKLQQVSVIAYALTGLPEAINFILDQIHALFPSVTIQLPAWASTLENHVVAICAATIWLVSKLTVLDASDPNKLPFTNK